MKRQSPVHGGFRYLKYLYRPTAALRCYAVLVLFAGEEILDTTADNKLTDSIDNNVQIQPAFYFNLAAHPRNIQATSPSTAGLQFARCERVPIAFSSSQTQ